MSGISGPKRDLIVNRQLCHWFRADMNLGIPKPVQYDLLNRGRRSIAVDLKHPDGVATVLRLVEPTR